MSTPVRVLKAIEKRDKGRNCCWPELHPCDPETVIPQHRMGGMGGSKTKHRLSNVVWLCSRLNGLIEDDAGLAEMARSFGIKVPFWGNTTCTPVRYPDGLFYLDDSGGRSKIDETPY